MLTERLLSAQSSPRPTPKGVIFSLRRDEDLEGQKKILDGPSDSEARPVTSDGEVVSSAEPSGPASSDSESKRPKSTSTEYYIPPPLERDNG